MITECILCLPIKQVLARDVVSSILYEEDEQWAYHLSDTITEVFSLLMYLMKQ